MLQYVTQEMQMEPQRDWYFVIFATFLGLPLSRGSPCVDVHVDLHVLHLLELDHEEGEHNGHTDGLKKSEKDKLHSFVLIAISDFMY